MAGESKTTIDREEIRRWVEQRGGRPAPVAGTGSDDALEEISPDERFRAFDENGLAFVYQDETNWGGERRFSKFVSRCA